MIFYDKMKILAQHLLHLADYARLREVPLQDMLSLVGLKEADLRMENAEVAAEDFYRVLALVNSRLNDELLGIRLGNFLQLKSLGLVYQISLQAASVQEALFYLQSYLDATFPVVRPGFSVSPDEASIVFTTAEAGKTVLERLILENVMTVVARELQAMAGRGFSPGLFSPFYSAVYPEGWAYSEVFAVRFQPVVLTAALQKDSLSNYDILVPEYVRMIEGLRDSASFSGKVKMVSLSLSQPELPGLEAVADVFHLTPRTLQRRLGAERTSFREVSNELKKQLAGLLIRHQRFSVTDISNVLGFSEPASFIHSFKRWFGETPERMRRQLGV